MDESARKRKRGDAGDDDDDASEGPLEGDDEDVGSEMPKEGLKRGEGIKKAKADEESEKNKNTPGTSAEELEARKKQKEDKKAQKKDAQKEKKKAKETSKKEKQNKPAQQDAPQETDNKKAKEQKQKQKPEPAQDKDDDSHGEDELDEEGPSFDFNEHPEQTSTSSSTPNSPGFDASNLNSGSSSISSIVPPTANESAKQDSSDPKPLKPTPEELKQRLQKRLDELRAARHADGLNGRPARNRQELIEARRQKAEQRKAHKKELRQKAREEEQRKDDEAMARRFSPGSSGSLLASPRSPAESTGSNNANYSFGQVVFADGQHTDPSLTNLRDKPKKHGAQDPASALRAAEAKKERLDSMNETKRADVEQKDMWLNAKKRAHGERVRDDTSLLKKALKRKESAKRKSEREWKERHETIKKGQDTKQHKRDDNLRKRRDDKISNKIRKATGTPKKKAKARPGFEGSFKAKVGGKKK